MTRSESQLFTILVIPRFKMGQSIQFLLFFLYLHFYSFSLFENDWLNHETRVIHLYQIMCLLKYASWVERLNNWPTQIAEIEVDFKNSFFLDFWAVFYEEQLFFTPTKVSHRLFMSRLSLKLFPHKFQFTLFS